MSTKYTMLEREISDINLDKEDHKNENHLAIHRTKNCVIYYETQKPSKKSESQNCGFRSEIGKVFRPHGAIRQVTPIYNKISKTYFNKNYIKDPIYFKDDKKNEGLRKIEQKTKNYQKKIKSLSASKNSNFDHIRSKICSTNRRLQHLKVGNSFSSSFNTKNSTDSLQDEIMTNTNYQKINRTRLIERCRNLSLEEKLNFYDENPDSAKRRIKTAHLP